MEVGVGIGYFGNDDDGGEETEGFVDHSLAVREVIEVGIFDDI